MKQRLDNLHLGRWRRAAPAWIAAALLVAAPLTAQTPPLTLDDCIRRALTYHPRAAAASAGIRASRSLLMQADAARYFPQVEFTQMFGPSPSASGSPYDPALRSDFTDLGPFTRSEATLLMPVYTFGKLAGKAEAARHGISVAQYAQDQVAAEIRRDTRRIYYGVLLAGDLKELAGDVLKRIARARARVRELTEEESSSPSLRYRLDIVGFEVEARRVAAVAAEESLLEALKAAVGLPASAAFNLSGRLERAESRPVDREQSIHGALQLRPEVRQAREGVEARSALLRSAKADLFPQFFLGGQLRHGYAPNRTDQKNPFIRDDFNFLQGGIAMGFRFTLTPSGTRARIEQAAAERDGLIAQQRMLESAIGVQAGNAVRAARAAASTLEIREKAARAARAWLATAESTFNLGVGEARDLADAFQAYIQTRAALLQALYEEHIARAELDYAEGRP